MSLDYLTAYNDYADAKCATPVSVINYYPEPSYSACEALAANVSGCATSDYFLAYSATCITSGFHNNGLSAFGSSPFTEVFIYSSATCSDSNIANLRQYRNNGCYQFSGGDGFGGLSRMGAASVSKSSFDIMIFNDTACSVFYQNITFVADNSTCQKSAFFNAGNYVKTNIVTPSVSTTSTVAGTTTFTVSSNSSVPSPGTVFGAAFGVFAFIVIVVFAVNRSRANRRAPALLPLPLPPVPNPPAPIPQPSQTLASYDRLGVYGRSNMSTVPLSEQLPPYSVVGSTFS